MLILLMGVSGCGKSTIGKQLGASQQLPFHDADDFHPESNIQKMQAGTPLNDDDRFPWLQLLAGQLATWEATGGAVLACSALKESYRRILASKVQHITWVYLDGSMELIQARLAQREGHFMPTKLLHSQFDTLEIPTYGIHLSCADTPSNIVFMIQEQLNKPAEFGLIGLGVMGKSISLNIAEKGVRLAVYNRASAGEETVVADFLQASKAFELQGYTDLSAFVQGIARPRRILMMIKAGKVVDAVLEELTPLLHEGDIVIDGGNSHYQDTKRRFEQLQTKGIHFVGAGVSGGEAGARSGPSIMPGGTLESYALVAPILETIAAKDRAGRACCTYIGKGGAGHFIKMVHNGIEYVEMQLLAELYALLAPSMKYRAIADLFADWNKGDLSSYLLEITAHILRRKEEDVYLLDLILDKAGNKGTGSWSSKAALDTGTVNTLMVSSVFARYVSALKTRRVQLSKHIATTTSKCLMDVQVLEKAYRAARILNHQQGFALMQEASKQYDWGLNQAEIARIWTNGCIIRSHLMEELVAGFRTQQDIFDEVSLFQYLQRSEADMAKTIQYAMQQRIASPSFSAAYNYWISMTTERLPANLIQAQRDYFGAHTYQRVDSKEEVFFHTDWD